MIRSIPSFTNAVHTLWVYALVLCFATLSGCDSDDSEDITTTTEEEASTPLLNTFSIKSSYTASEAQLVAIFGGLDSFLDAIEYDITVYKISYFTDYQGEQVEASGLVCIPEGLTETAPILSIQHGTTFNNNAIPSVDSDPTGFELFASTGFITVIPDFIGYGTSNDILHPYYDAALSASAVIDMITASKELATQLDIPYNDKLFLAGYSEGGYVTMATHKTIEETATLNLTVNASATGAGGYDIHSILDHIQNTEIYPSPNYLAFIIHAYNTTNNWERPLSDFFQEPYASRIPDLLDGTYGGGEINAQLTTSTNALLNSDFLNALSNGDELAFQNALIENSVHNWHPIAPLRLYHGTEDEIVPYDNSVTTYNTMVALGTEDITLISTEGGTHSSTLSPMINDVATWFLSLK